MSKVRRPRRGHKIKIRPIEEAHLPAVRSLLAEHAHLFDPPYSKEAIGRELIQLEKYRTGLVAMLGDRLVGFIRYGHTDHRIDMLRGLNLARPGQNRHGYIFSLLVHPEHSRAGLGTRLVKEALDKIGEMRYPDGSRVGEVVMTHHEGNAGTRGIGRRLGFRKVGEFEAHGRLKHGKTILLHKPLPHHSQSARRGTSLRAGSSV